MDELQSNFKKACVILNPNKKCKISLYFFLKFLIILKKI